MRLESSISLDGHFISLNFSRWMMRQPQTHTSLSPFSIYSWTIFLSNNRQHFILLTHCSGSMWGNTFNTIFPTAVNWNRSVRMIFFFWETKKENENERDVFPLRREFLSVDNAWMRQVSTGFQFWYNFIITTLKSWIKTIYSLIVSYWNELWVFNAY